MSRSNIEAGRIMGSLLLSENKLGIMKQTLTAQIALDADMPHLIVFDPGGAARDVLLPPEADGMFFIICNSADAAESLVVKEDSDTTTIGTVVQGGVGLFVCGGGVWYGLVDTTA